MFIVKGADLPSGNGWVLPLLAEPPDAHNCHPPSGESWLELGCNRVLHVLTVFSLERCSLPAMSIRQEKLGSVSWLPSCLKTYFLSVVFLENCDKSTYRWWSQPPWPLPTWSGSMSLPSMAASGSIQSSRWHSIAVILQWYNSSWSWVFEANLDYSDKKYFKGKSWSLTLCQVLSPLQRALFMAVCSIGGGDIFLSLSLSSEEVTYFFHFHFHWRKWHISFFHSLICLRSFIPCGRRSQFYRLDKTSILESQLRHKTRSWKTYIFCDYALVCD